MSQPAMSQARQRPQSRRDTRTPIGPTRKRLRDLKRMLGSNDNLPADVRRDHERELAACEQTINDKKHHDARSDMIGRYHMVRFFERQKATRMLKQAMKSLRAADDPAERDRIELFVHRAEVDVNYTKYYPLSQPYVSLYVDEKGKQHALEGSTTRGHHVWKLVEEKMTTGNVETLREEGWEEHRAKIAAKVPKQKPRSNLVDRKDSLKERQASRKDETQVRHPDPGVSQPRRIRRQQARLQAQQNQAKMDEESDGADGAGFFE